jgi:hypothetical protein
MKTCTVIAALIMGICLNLSAQNKGKSYPHFESYKTFIATVSLPNSDTNSLFIGGFRLQMAENKTRKTFAELNDLGEEFYVDATWESVKDWLVQEDLLSSDKAQKNNLKPSVDAQRKPDLDKY